MLECVVVINASVCHCDQRDHATVRCGSLHSATQQCHCTATLGNVALCSVLCGFGWEKVPFRFYTQSTNAIISQLHPIHKPSRFCSVNATSHPPQPCTREPKSVRELASERARQGRARHSLSVTTRTPFNHRLLLPSEH
mmetsp:Transcript_42952/g.87892  ORF Transcript_42952/g.87892 Transcript_42952/m.87892 type:complete len:139 (+) Transcript_42952:1966-2382(+)